MRTPNPDYYRQDEAGQWWYQPKNRPRTRAHSKVCAACDTPYVIDAYHAKRSRYCSRQCACRVTGMARRRGDQHPGWKGGRRRTSDGYVLVYAPEHPTLRGKRAPYIREHRLVMEQAIGRLLESHETVHHINGDKTDNRIENLQLRSGQHGPGVVHRCQDCGSSNVTPEEV